MGLFWSKVVYLEKGYRKGKYLFDHRQNPCPLTDNICAISVWLVATLNVHKLILNVCSSLAKFGLILCKAHVLPAAFQSLICFRTF
jgi:lipoate-protein ligase B